jgi:hypothetical protein
MNQALGRWKMERTSLGVTELICELRSQGMSYQKIADYLTKEQIQTVCNRAWHKSSVWAIVKREQTKTGGS